jgi:sugar lactone lactonase YvrE
MMQAELFYNIPCRLGEGSMWHAKRNQLFWIDIEKCRLHNIDPKTKIHQAWKLDTMVGTIVPDEKGRIVMGMEGYVARFDPDTGDVEKLLTIDEPKGNRSNDGKCDPGGRFWQGTQNMKEIPGTANLYCIYPDLTIEKKVPGTTVSNGIVWTKDKKTMYFIDSPTQCVQQFDYDDVTGNIQFVKKAIEVPHDLGTPDGMTIDENDRLWIAHWGGSAVYHWDPVSGKIIDKIDVPAPHVTSCVFGGDTMNTLYITTAWSGLSDEDREKYPLSGSVFSAQTSTRGFPPNIFKG